MIQHQLTKPILLAEIASYKSRLRMWSKPKTAFAYLRIQHYEAELRDAEKRLADIPQWQKERKG